MDQIKHVAQVALIISLSEHESGASRETAEYLADLLKREQLPATWAVSGPIETSLAHLLQGHEVALHIGEDSAAPSGSSEASLQHPECNLSQTTAEVGVVVGDAQVLRSRVAGLAECGVRAIVAAQATQPTPLPFRPLACGLWSLQATVWLPFPRGVLSLLSSHRPAIEQLLTSQCQQLVYLDAVAWESAGARRRNEVTRLLSDLGAAARGALLQPVSVSELVVMLAESRRVTPQRSILRLAA